MPTISGWLATEGQPEAIAEVIGAKSTSVTVNRNGSDLAAQTVRLETLAGERQIQGSGGITYTVDALILAEYGANLKVGDRFSVNSQAFEIVAVLPGHIDCVQCYLKLRG